jgi:YggT family protein
VDYGFNFKHLNRFFGKFIAKIKKVRIIMLVFRNLLVAVATVVDYVLVFFMFITIARAVLSWVSPDPYNPIVRFIHNITEPVLYQIRKRLPMMYGGIDFSPIVVILIIIFLRIFVVNSLEGLAQSLG